ncbi:MAG: hypothetical protein IPP29_01310 [Bacteroidetes bacterium]|nr:hypothetical protein [Bacteroidota bacterium]
MGNDTSSCGNLLLIPNVPGNSYLWSNGSTNNTIVADTTGTYILNMISTNGCTYNDSINVVIHPPTFIQFYRALTILFVKMRYHKL